MKIALEALGRVFYVQLSLGSGPAREAPEQVTVNGAETAVAEAPPVPSFGFSSEVRAE